jgi:hypothetical protein
MSKKKTVVQFKSNPPVAQQPGRAVITIDGIVITTVMTIDQARSIVALLAGKLRNSVESLRPVINDLGAGLVDAKLNLSLTADQELMAKTDGEHANSDSANK